MRWCGVDIWYLVMVKEGGMVCLVAVCTSVRDMVNNVAIPFLYYY
jgi:hypothetical protein